MIIPNFFLLKCQVYLFPGNTSEKAEQSSWPMIYATKEYK